jgi:pilus assembly protein Flp/PilA
MRKCEEARGATLKRDSGSSGMPNVFKLLSNACKDEEGAALVEYAILVGLIAVVCIVAITQLGLAISGSLSTTCTSLGGTTC